MERFLTQNRDADREILLRIKNNRELLVFCSSEYGKKLCDENFFKRYIQLNYPDIYKLSSWYYYKYNQSWKQFYLRIIYEIAIINEICSYIKDKIEKNQINPNIFYLQTLEGDAPLNYIVDKLTEEHVNVEIPEYFQRTYNRYFRNSPYGEILSPENEITEREIDFLKGDILKENINNRVFPQQMSDFLNYLIRQNVLPYNIKIKNLCPSLKLKYRY